MLKIKNEKGELVWQINDEDTEPRLIGTFEDDVCPRCHQRDTGQKGKNPCKLCGLPTELEEEKVNG